MISDIVLKTFNHSFKKLLLYVSLHYSIDNNFQLFDTLSVLTLVFLLFLILPSVPFYKHLEKQKSEATAQQSSIDEHGDKYQLGPRFDKPPYTICQ